MQTHPAVSLATLCVGLVLTSPLAGQSLRTETNKALGFKLVLPRFLKEVPPQPDEQLIIAKYKGTEEFKLESTIVNQRTGERYKEVPIPVEVWVVRIEAPGVKAVITPSGGKEAKVEKASVREQVLRAKNDAKSIDEFLQKNINKRVMQSVSSFKSRRPWKNKNGEIWELRRGGGRDEVFCMSKERRDPGWGHEDLGVLVIWPMHPALHAREQKKKERVLEKMVKGFQRLPPEKRAFAAADPYEGRELPGMARRREVRKRLVDGWYAQDTENFILITDMPSNTSTRELLKDMLADLEIMRREYAKRFPPIKPLTVVGAVRVCHSYDGYIRYSAKPGTGGFWHPLTEELVLFNPKGKVRAAEWMRKVSTKGILYHEAMHQYFHYSNGEMPPASWFNEGYGEYFGGCKTDQYAKNIRLVEKNEFRWSVVKEVRRTGQFPSLKKLLAMTQQQFYSRKPGRYSVGRNYAFGWAICYFLELERKKPKGARNEEWATLADRYLVNLRAAAAEFKEKLSDDAPKGAILRFAIPVQKAAYEKTFKDFDWDKLQVAFEAAVKSW